VKYCGKVELKLAAHIARVFGAQKRVLCSPREGKAGKDLNDKQCINAVLRKKTYPNRNNREQIARKNSNKCQK
jgi:hypothetical protein